MRLKEISEAIMWLPGFAPEDDPIVAPETMPAVCIPLTSLQAAVDNAPPTSVVTEPVVAAEPEVKAVWPRLTSDAIGAWGGKVTKFQNNVAAIKLLQELEKSDRQPEEDERLVLQRYTGWGGLPAAFNDDQSDADWVKRSAELKQILSPDEWESARNSTPNAHYTDLPYIDAIWTTGVTQATTTSTLRGPIPRGVAPRTIQRSSNAEASTLRSRRLTMPVRGLRHH